MLSLITLGYRNAAIAEELGISEPTAKRHVHNILEKLGVPDAGGGGEARPRRRRRPADYRTLTSHRKTSNGHGRPAVAAR